MENIKCLMFDCYDPEVAATCKTAVSQVVLRKHHKKKILMVVGLDAIGECHSANDFLRSALEADEKNPFKDAVIALVVLSKSDLYTKSFTKKFLFVINQLGAECIGHPLVELTVNYGSLKSWSKALNLSTIETAKQLIFRLTERLAQYEPLKVENLKTLVLHDGQKERSNTLMLWDMVEKKLREGVSQNLLVKTLHVEEGQIRDCFGCSFETCNYFALEKSCFYGGFVVEELFPLIEEADVVVWICPNYNDAISAKLMAVVNRLTSLYRKTSFTDKYLLSVIVSANSGSDSVAGQLIGALSVNKGFRLPPNFALMGQANAPGEIKRAKGIQKRVTQYVCQLIENIYG